MQITIVQAEIEIAIAAYIRTIIHVKDGMDINMELKATRGDTGFQALIDISPTKPKQPRHAELTQAPQATQQEAPAGPAAAQPPAAPVAQSPAASVFAPPPVVMTPRPTPVEVKPEPEVVAEKPVADPAPEPIQTPVAANEDASAPVDATAKPATRSLFRGLRQPGS